MKRHELFTEDDIEQIRSRGLTPEAVEEQVEKFEKGTPYLKLNRPCTPGDGIRRLSEEEAGGYIEKYESEAVKKRLIKFVPASGAATRMFKTLIKANTRHEKISKNELDAGILDSEDENNEIRKFFENIKSFAFFSSLERALSNQGFSAEDISEMEDLKPVLDFLLTGRGLGYEGKPKGLLEFHSYEDRARTAFEEHLVEASEYGRMENGSCSLHFTVSPEHQEEFEALCEKAAPEYEKRLNAGFEIEFSRQEPSTDTIAVDMENRPFRKKDGSLLFRPGGHGALIRNLNQLEGDMVFIKNIDNVCHDRFKQETTRWKKVLCGCLLEVQEQTAGYIKKLNQEQASEQLVREAGRFLENRLCVTPPGWFYKADTETRRKYLLNRLNRPLRVCGMVPNSGEPGGGPFWVEDTEGMLSIQIVETSQIDPDDKEQQSIRQGLTHFNPVDVVCSLCGPDGKRFDLDDYVDSGAVFIAYKSEEGRDLKALEHPGLWNGAMAFWNTVFVEVPLITFNPVKRVNDLLRSPHQPSD